ncbi:MAG: adenylate kinase [Candidatus Eisenbacteria bacterium]|nr:adenylate kinase [Candidatus Eisenbacteria bacterium]
MHVVLLGPPGVGKGTQGRRVAEDRGWALISTGEMLRESARRGTPFGLEAQRKMNDGLLVPDDVMIALVRERTGQEDAARGFLLDGFPRTVPQADALDRLLAERGSRVDLVLSLTASEEELVRRLTERRECPVCKRAYNLESAPPRDGRTCDSHPGVELTQREDDQAETVKQRFRVYREQTAPLIDYYRRSGHLREVHGVGTVDEVYRDLQSALSGAAGPA